MRCSAEAAIASAAGTVAGGGGGSRSLNVQIVCASPKNLKDDNAAEAGREGLAEGWYRKGMGKGNRWGQVETRCSGFPGVSSVAPFCNRQQTRMRM